MARRNLFSAVIYGIAGYEVVRTARRARRARKGNELRSDPANQLLATASHDLRNPVNAISLASSNLAERPNLSAHEKKLVDIISRSAKQIDGKIQQFLDIAKLEAGHMLRLEKGSIPVKELLNEALDLSHSHMAQKAIKLGREYENANWMVEADRQRILQVLLSLIENAARICPRESIITVGASKKGHEGLFWVSDNAPGLSLDEQDKIFQPFQRNPQALPQTRGLGLAIARQIVNQHGGDIWIESSSGIGTTFRFTLPLTSAFAAVAQ